MVWSAAQRTEVRDSAMPQYQEQRMGQGERMPLGRIVGQEPVEVRQPQTRAL